MTSVNPPSPVPHRRVIAAPKHAEPIQDPEASLTEDEKHFAEQLKVDPKQIAAFKSQKKK